MAQPDMPSFQGPSVAEDSAAIDAAELSLANKRCFRFGVAPYLGHLKRSIDLS